MDGPRCEPPRPPEDVDVVARGLPPYAALVLAGGAGRRLGGVDKPALEVGGRTLLQRAVDAVRDARPLVVVGPERPLAVPVSWVLEEPAGGGPVAALAAGLALTTSSPTSPGPVYTALLAGDLPFVQGDVVRRLRVAAAGRDGAVVVDDAGRDQLLLGVWRTEALRDRLHDLRRLGRLGDPPGGPLRRVLAGLDIERLRLPPAARPPWWDCDTPADLDEARRRAAAGGDVQGGVGMNRLEEWTDAVVASLGLPPEVGSREVRDLVLDLTRDVAHGVARPAAPLTSFLVGLAAGREGASPEAVRAAVERVLAQLPEPLRDR